MTKTFNTFVSEPVTTPLPVNQAITETNSVLAGCGTHWLYRGSYINLETGKNGIRWLIAEILEKAQAVFPLYSGNSRNTYLAYGLTTEEIVSKVRSVNGFDKYTVGTIETYLSVYMADDQQVSRIQMTTQEDKNRTSKKPRCKWYLIAEKQ